MNASARGAEIAAASAPHGDEEAAISGHLRET